jgi:hypothetical protein
MYLVYNPPMMNPTTLLHPAKTTENPVLAMVKRHLLPEAVEARGAWLDREFLWWAGLGMTSVGSLLYYCF